MKGFNEGIQGRGSMRGFNEGIHWGHSIGDSMRGPSATEGAWLPRGGQMCGKCVEHDGPDSQQ